MKEINPYQDKVFKRLSFRKFLHKVCNINMDLLQGVLFPSAQRSRGPAHKMVFLRKDSFLGPVYMRKNTSLARPGAERRDATFQ